MFGNPWRLMGAVLIFGATNVALGQGLSLDDFSPEGDGGSGTDPNAINAETIEEGVSRAYQRIKSDGFAGGKLINTDTGFAYLSTEFAGYRTYDNINATLLSKRNAYFKAYVNARKGIVEFMEGMSSECSAQVEDSTVAMDTGVESVANMFSSTSEECVETVSGMVNGYIVYAIEDLVDEKSVMVSVLTSTKTQGAVDRIGETVVNTTDPEAAFQGVLEDIANFATPPLGARLISDVESGAYTVVGFGSAIIRQNSDPMMARRLRSMAQDVSETRARSALVSYLSGDEIYWEGGFQQEQMENAEQFFVPENEDGTPGSPQKHDETQSQFLNVMSSSNASSSVTSGQLPPGTRLQSFTSEDGYWRFTVAVYQPAFTSGAIDSIESGGANTNSSDVNMSGGANEDAANPQGPSGAVVPQHDF